MNARSRMVASLQGSVGMGTKEDESIIRHLLPHLSCEMLVS